MATHLVPGMTGDIIRELHNRLAQRDLPAAAAEREGATFGPSTAGAVKRWQVRKNLPATGVVDEATAASLEIALPEEPPAPPEFPYLVRGQILYRGGLPIPGLIVRAFHRDLRKDTELGARKTNADGNFEIYYNTDGIPAPPGLPGGRPPDLCIRVFERVAGPPPAEKMIIESPTRFAAQRVTKFRLLVDGGPTKTWSEYEQLMQELKPYLGDVRVADLAEDAKRQDVTLLSGKLAQDPQRVAALVAAHKLAAEVKGDPEVFYAFARQGLPTNMAELFAVSPGARSRALVSASREGIVSGKLQGEVQRVRKQFEEHAAAYAAADKQVAGRASLGAVLKVAVPDQQKVNTLVERLMAHTGSPAKLWQSLSDDPQLGPLVPDAQLTLQLAAVTGRHLPLIKTLRRQRAAGRFTSVASLAKFTERDWLDIINTPGVAEAERVPPSIPGKDAAEKAKVYAATITRLITDAMPTQVIAHKAQTDPAQAADVKAFWKNVTEEAAGFELGRGRLRPYLEEHPALLAGVNDKNAVIGHLEETQRLFNLTQDYGEQQALRKAGMGSALAVARLGEGVFLQQAKSTGLTPQRAMLIYQSAMVVAAAALDMVATYTPGLNSYLPKVVPSPLVRQAPNLETLFGTFNLCGCDQCRSVHSPAAYFADVLAYLADRASSNPGESARDILFRRRPDLGEVELTCPNTNTVLPYTDLVNEILERRIAPFAMFPLPAAAEAQLNAKTLSPAVRGAFAAQQIELAASARVIVGATSNRWSITDGSVLYSIRKSGGAIRVTGAWPQTGASADHLAAVPEHINPAAYAILRREVYPWILPLDLPTEEVRLFLDHLGCSRHELMAELFPGGPPAALDAVAVAAEYLGLSDAERQYVTSTVQAPNAPRQPWEFWGLNQNANTVTVFDPAVDDFADRQLGWLQSLAWVRQVLRRSGMEYEELVRVLGCTFVNPGMTVRITSADPNEPATCDTTKLTLTNLTAAIADRLARFVRLWRKLGWEAEELDRVLVALCGGDLNNAAIVKLSHVARLRTAFGRTVDELVTLWALIPISGRAPLYERLFLNPAVLIPVDPAFALDAGGELAILASDPVDAKISKHAPPVLAALRITSSDLVALQAAGIAADDNLTLANLSNLYRHALLALCLEMTIPDLLLYKTLAGIDPFDAARTGDAVRFVDLVAKVRRSGFEIADLAYLLFHQSPETAALAPPEGAIAELIADVRRRLKVIRDDTAPRPDPAGDHLCRALAAVRWPASMIDEVSAALGGTAPYTVALDPAPAGFAVPASFAARLAHDDAARTLTLTGPLTTGERDELKAAFPEVNYKTAIDQLHAQPLTFTQTRMRAYDWPAVSAPLAVLPAGLSFPPALRARVSHDPAVGMLFFDGTMTAADQAALDALSPDPAYRAATTALLAAANAFVPGADNRFITAAVAAALFELPLAADRFGRVLEMVLLRRRTNDGTRLVIRVLADAVGLRYRFADRLLTRDLPHPLTPGKKGIDAFLEEPFAASNPEVPPVEAAFPAVFEITLRLMKIAALVRQMKLSNRVIDWLGDFAAEVLVRKVPWGGGVIQSKWLALTELPAGTEAPDPVRFAAWLRVAELSRLGGGLPGGESTAGDTFAEARKPGATANSVIDRLATLTGWNAVDLTAVAAALGLALPQDALDEVGLSALRDAARRLNRLGTSAEQALAWAVPEPASVAGLAARRAVQASYSADQWPDAIRPLEEKLRETRRAALVAYLVARPDAARGESWIDTNGMYAHLLIDVETQPVVLTSRLKQAIGSAQLFVQRCLLNLEPDVIADEARDIGWRQWIWMKQYRVWEANRRVFLYPENWIVPELRDDKSPFFLELENTLLQADVTDEAAEDAYVTYLARLDEVARLEVAGTYYQPGEGGQPDEFHVFARTHATPPTYFYRRWVGQARWTPWERLDLDIPNRQILPVVWNRRLYLFWPLFAEKADPPPPGGDAPANGTPFYEIQLAWSEYRRGKWGPKKTTPAEVTLRSKIDPPGLSKHVFRATTSGANLLIWYESTETSAPSVNQYGNLVGSGSIVRTDGWRFTGCNGRVETFKPSNVGVYAPPNTKPAGMFYVEKANTDGTLQLPKGLSGTATDVALRITPGPVRFRLLSPHQERYLTGQLPFFFHDDSETLFVVPVKRRKPTRIIVRPEVMGLVTIDVLDHIYYQPEEIPDLLGPISGRWDPVPVIHHRYKMENGANGLGVPRIDVLAEPIVPALPTASLAAAVEIRGRQVKPMSGTAERELVAYGDRAVMRVSVYLDTDRLYAARRVSRTATWVRRYEFRAFYHRYVCPMMRDLNVGGIDGLLRRATQLRLAKPFETRYSPTSLVERGNPVTKDKYPVEDVDFDFDGAYAGYNWELFFHVPLMIACKLSQNQRFEEALRWFHAIFDPTDASATQVPAKYWRTRPFHEQQDYLNQRIDRLLEALAKGESDEDLSLQLSEWIANPFRPFAVARLRTVAFQKTVVMKYLDNLIAWGDQLFRRDTIESINEATQLYILAAEILGPRPPVIAPRAQPETHTFNTLAPRFAELTNALTDIEIVLGSPRVDAVLTSTDTPPLPIPQLLYFCVPPNDKLLKYWDTVADRLFKIRNSLNLAGIRRTLPLFEPPIDPMLLVKAVAAGVDLSTAIADLAAPAPLYRFSVLVQKTAELCQDVRSLGAALLAALERRDAEELARIQAGHEIALLKRVTTVKEDQIKESKAEIEALLAAREVTAERYRHYMTLLGAAPTIPAEGTAPADAQAVAGAATLEKDGVRMIAQESNELTEMADATDAEESASNWDAASNFSYYVPMFAVEACPWGIGVTVEFGGQHIGPALTAIANLNRSSAADHRHKAQKASRLASFIMRANDWKLEANAAAREIVRIDKQVAAARIREALATRERDNHLKQIEESERVEEYLRTKYTNRELYDWMIGQLSAVYFQSYQLAYDVARRTERAFRFELAVPDTDFIRFGYWDSLRKGLLAGDRLLHDVRRMEVAYLDQNAREYEITRHVSLASLHPEGLLALQEQGTCFLDLPEAVFDLDHPGHYLRRIKAVNVTIPSTTGANTSVPCKLTLLANRTRVDTRPTPQYAWSGPDDQRFVYNSGGVRSVVTSTGRDDPASFELNLRDERYLPFEGAGAVSSWRLELPDEFRPFDYRTISDVVLHIRYTAREGGQGLRDAAIKKLADALKAMEVQSGRAGLFRGFSGRHEFPDTWNAFARMPDGQPGNPTLALPITADRFPAFAARRTVKIARLLVALVPAPGIAYADDDPVTVTLTPPVGAAQALTLAVRANRAGGLPAAEVAFAAPVTVAALTPGNPPPAPWKIEVTHVSANLARTVTVNGVDVARIDPAKVSDVGVLCAYTV
jgi:hypothetical protein